MGDDNSGGGVEHGDILVAMAEAMVSGNETRISNARNHLREAMGDAAFVDTCATIASFNAVVKLADGAGIPLEDYKEKNTRDIREQLSIDEFLT